MTNNQKEERIFDIPLDFLQERKKYLMTSYEDGINAAHQAMDFRKQERTLRKGDRIKIRLVRELWIRCNHSLNTSFQYLLLLKTFRKRSRYNTYIKHTKKEKILQLLTI